MPEVIVAKSSILLSLENEKLDKDLDQIWLKL